MESCWAYNLIGQVTNQPIPKVIEDNHWRKTLVKIVILSYNLKLGIDFMRFDENLMRVVQSERYYLDNF